MINFTAITVARPICLVVLSVGMQACVIPIPFPSAEIVIIEKELIESIRIGQTSKVDLQHNLGPPDWSLNDGSRWMYYTRTYRPAGLGLLVDGVGSVPLIDWRTEFLYLTFNGSDVIDNREISLAEPDPGAGWSKREVKSESEVNSNICIDGYNKPLAYGSADDDKYAKRFRAEPNSCAAYLYTSTTVSPFFVKIDELDARYRCPSSVGFLRINFESGEHKITVAYQSKVNTRKIDEAPQSGQEQSKAIEFDCAPGEVYFMREYHNEIEGFAFTMMRKKAGRRSIAERNLVLLQELD